MSQGVKWRNHDAINHSAFHLINHTKQQDARLETQDKNNITSTKIFCF